MKQQIWCFSTPTRRVAVEHLKNHFGWMLAGEQLYAELSSTHPLYVGAWDSQGAVCIETFPQAVVCALCGSAVSAKRKRTIRRQALIDIGIDVGMLSNIDLVDAALCAVAARFFEYGTYTEYGLHGGRFDYCSPRIPTTIERSVIAAP